MTANQDDPHAQILPSLGIMLRRARRISQRSIAGLDARLDPSTYPLLSFLHRNPGASLSGVAGAQGVSKGTMSRQVARLESFGLIARTMDETDCRGVRLTLTEGGDELVQKIKARQVAALSAATEGWDAADLAHFSELMQRFAHDLEAADTDACGPTAAK